VVEPGVGVEPSLGNYAWYLKKEGYRPSTIHRHIKALRRLPLEDPERVKEIVTSASWSEGVKELVCNCLQKYYEYTKVPFSKPIYRRIEKIQFTPTSEEASDLISSLSKQISTFCQFRYNSLDSWSWGIDGGSSMDGIIRVGSTDRGRIRLS